MLKMVEIKKISDIKDGEGARVDCPSCDYLRLIVNENGKLVIDDKEGCLNHRRECVVKKVEELNRH